MMTPVVTTTTSSSPSASSPAVHKEGDTAGAEVAESSGGGFAALIGRFEKVAQAAQEKQTQLVVAHGGGERSSSNSPKRSQQSSSSKTAEALIKGNEASPTNSGTSASNQDRIKDSCDTKDKTALTEKPQNTSEERKSAGSDGPSSFAAVIQQFETKKSIRTPPQESNSNTEVLLNIATNGSDANKEMENAAFVPTDDESNNESQSDANHNTSKEEEAEARIKEALKISASSSNLPSSQLADGEIIVSDEKTDETHDAELNAFYKSIKKSKHEEEPFVPPSHIKPHRKNTNKKRDAFGEHAPPKEEIEVLSSQKEEKRVSSKETIQRSDSYHEDHPVSDGDLAVSNSSVVREPGGHRIEIDYSKPPPNFVEARPSRRRQRVREEQLIAKQQVGEQATLNAMEGNNMSSIPENVSAKPDDEIGQQQQQQIQRQPIHSSSTPTSMTSSEPGGKRLPTVYTTSPIPGYQNAAAEMSKRPPPKKVINQERIQSALDCKGILPKNHMYPTRRTPVDVPGSKLPNKFPGQSDIEDKVIILQQQVALAEQVIRLRAMKHESEQLKASLKLRQRLQTVGSATNTSPDNDGDKEECIAQQQQEQQDASKKLLPEASFQNRSALLAKLTAQPNSLSDFQKKGALLAKLTAEPEISTYQKQQKAGNSISTYKYQQHHHKQLRDQFQDDLRVTQSMHDEMVKLVQTSFGSKPTKATSPSSSKPTEIGVAERRMTQKQLLQQLEYDSLRQQMEYEKLMQKLGEMMGTSSAPQTQFASCPEDTVPFDEREPQENLRKSLGRNTPLERKEERTKSPVRRLPLHAPPMHATVSKAPPPSMRLRTIDAIPPPSASKSQSASKLRPNMFDTMKHPDVTCMGKAAPTPQSYEVQPNGVQRDGKTKEGERQINWDTVTGIELSHGREMSIGKQQQQQQSEQDRWRQILSSSGSLV